MAVAVLNNRTLTSTSYTDEATAIFQKPARKYTLIVANAAVYMQLQRVQPGLKAGAGAWEPEEFLVPGVYSRIPSDFSPGGVRFRAVTNTEPFAQVSARPA